MCGVRPSEKRLYCAHRAGTPVVLEPKLTSVEVDRLKKTFSWFDCWTSGDRTAKQNTIWYHTTGDAGRVGYVPANYLETEPSFDLGDRSSSACRSPKKASLTAADRVDGSLKRF